LLKLLAPLDGNDDFELLASSSADEFYFGFLPTTHVERYTNLYSLNRRAYTRCNFSDWESLGQALQTICRKGKGASCAFNSTYYLDGEYPIILGHAQRMLDLGVSTVIVSDPGLMSYLRDNGYDGEIHAGIDTPVFNSEGVQFLHEQFGVRRVVVNRHMDLSEVRGMTAAAPEGVEFDIIVRNAACRHIAGFCGNLHGLDVPSGLDNWEERQFPCWQPMKVVGMSAPDDVDSVMLKVWLERSSSLRYGGCGACALRDIGEVGITQLKIAGRGSTTRKKLTDIRFIAAARKLAETGGSMSDYRMKVKELYKRSYEVACSTEECFHG
jgi:U32 family peptidase